MNTCPDCDARLVAFFSGEAPVGPHGWRINDADITSVDFVCNECGPVDETELNFLPDGPPGFWEQVREAEALVRRAYEEALEDGNDEVTGPLAEALVWLDGKRPIS